MIPTKRHKIRAEGGEKMSPKLKALATITVWVLFIVGWLGVLAAIVGVVGISTRLYLIPNVEWAAMAGIFGGGVVCFILAACAIKLRQMLE